MPRHRAPSPAPLRVVRQAVARAAPRRWTGLHRAPSAFAPGVAMLLAYRQPAVLAAVIAAAVMVISTSPEKPPDVSSVQAADRDPVPAKSPARSKAPKKSDKDRPAPPRKDAPEPAPTGSTAPEPEPSAAPDTAPGERAEASGRRLSGPAGALRRTGSETVALTFDDGPDPEQTPRLLDLLSQHRVTATFCVVGTQVQRFPELVRRIAAEGHALCNHSWAHSFELGDRSADEIRKDLEDTNEAIRAAVPDARIPYFRAPGGFFTKRLVAVAAETGMRSIYWDVDPRDWEQPDDEDDDAHVDRIVEVVRAETLPGSIVLSHDFRQPLTVAAYERLLPELTGRFTLAALP